MRDAALVGACEFVKARLDAHAPDDESDKAHLAGHVPGPTRSSTVRWWTRYFSVRTRSAS